MIRLLSLTRATWLLALGLLACSTAPPSPGPEPSIEDPQPSPPPPTIVGDGRKVALLVANATYDNSSANLANPPNDVRLLSGTLKKIGFAPKIIRDVDKGTLRTELRAFTESIGKRDIVFFYYSGHGIALRGKNYILGRKFNAQDEVEAVEDGDIFGIHEVVDRLERTQAGVRIIVIDACRDEPFTRSWTRSAETRGFIPVQRQKASFGTLLAFSAGAGEKALDRLKGLKSGPYAHALSRRLIQAGEPAQMVFADVGSDIRKMTSQRQNPEYRDALNGRFFFVKKTAAQPSPGQPVPPPPETAPPAPPPSRPAEMVLIPEGPFKMGCNKAVDKLCGYDERPARTVDVANFFIDKTEVSVAEYQKCVDAGACKREHYAREGETKYCNLGLSDRRQHPMNCVSWHGADAYCRWAGKRLPTDREWEKAARGTDHRKYPWGNEEFRTVKRANIADSTGREFYKLSGALKNYTDGFGATGPVGKLPKGASPYGVLDMIGNVWEWTSDWFLKGDDYPSLRGGSWRDAPKLSRVSNRRGADAKRRSGDIGFRCAKSY